MKNEYEVRGDVTAIFINSPKYGRMETLIATSDLDRAKELKGYWCVKRDARTKSFYVQGKLPRREFGRNADVKLHRWLLNVTDTKAQVDHVCHDTLDNCRWALNTVTAWENQQNRRKHSNNSSGHQGVTWHAPCGKWRARIHVNGKNKSLGLYTEKADAITARLEAEVKYFRYLNSIKGRAM
jgi:hypothetical protein